MALNRAFSAAMDDATRFTPSRGMDSALPESIFDVKSRLLVWGMKKKPGNSTVLQPRYFELKRTRETFLLSWYKDDRSKKSQKASLDLRSVVAVYRPSREYRESGGDLSLDIVFPHKTYTILPKAGDPQSIRFIKLLSTLKPLKAEGWMMLARKPSPSVDIRDWEERHVRLNGSYLTYHKDDREGTKALANPIDLCSCRILRPSRMGPCSRNDPSSIDIVQITGHRADGAIRGKAALTLRQTYCPDSRDIANMILRFALLLTDKDPMNPENAKREMEQKEQNKDRKPSVRVDDQRTAAIRKESTVSGPPTPSADDLAAMADFSDDDSPPVPSPARVASSSTSFREDSRCAPYLRMLQMHMPEMALRHKMKGGGFTDSEIEAFLNDTSLGGGGGGGNKRLSKPRLQTPRRKSKDVPSAVAEFDFAGEADDPEQLPVKAGDRVTILEKFDDGWWNVKNSSGRTGIVPADFMKEL